MYLAGLQAFTDEQSAMLADLPSVEDGNFTQTEAGQAADAAFDSMDTDEGRFAFWHFYVSEVYFSADVIHRLGYLVSLHLSITSSEKTFIDCRAPLHYASPICLQRRTHLV